MVMHPLPQDTLSKEAGKTVIQEVSLFFIVTPHKNEGCLLKAYKLIRFTVQKHTIHSKKACSSIYYSPAPR